MTMNLMTNMGMTTFPRKQSYDEVEETQYDKDLIEVDDDYAEMKKDGDFISTGSECDNPHRRLIYICFSAGIGLA